MIMAKQLVATLTLIDGTEEILRAPQAICPVDMYNYINDTGKGPETLLAAATGVLGMAEMEAIPVVALKLEWSDV
jgi:hypothetical protein